MSYLLKTFQLRKTFDVLFLLMIICCRSGNKCFDVLFRRIRPYIFYQKMQLTRSVSKKQEGKVFIFRQSWHLLFADKESKILFPLLCLDLACKHLCLLLRKKFQIGEVEVQKNSCRLSFSRKLTIIPSIISFPYIIYWNCTKHFDFLHPMTIQY